MQKNDVGIHAVFPFPGRIQDRRLMYCMGWYSIYVAQEVQRTAGCGFDGSDSGDGTLRVRLGGHHRVQIRNGGRQHDYECFLLSPRLPFRYHPGEVSLDDMHQLRSRTSLQGR